MNYFIKTLDNYRKKRKMITFNNEVSIVNRKGVNLTLEVDNTSDDSSDDSCENLRDGNEAHHTRIVSSLKDTDFSFELNICFHIILSTAFIKPT